MADNNRDHPEPQFDQFVNKATSRRQFIKGVIASGAAEVRLGDAGLRLGSGDFFGELALITNQPRNADVVAEGYCHLLVLPRRDFNALLQKRPELRAEIHEVARRRGVEMPVNS